MHRSISLVAAAFAIGLALLPGCGGGGGGGGGVGSGTFVPEFLAADVGLDTTAFPSRGAMCCDGTTLYGAWIEGSVDVKFRRSLDGGATFEPTVTIGMAVTSASQLVLCCDGARVYAAWIEADPATLPNGFALRANASSDGGATWLPSPLRADSAAFAPQGLEGCCSGANFHLVWVDVENSHPSGRGVYANHSSDGGATWGVADARLDANESDSNGVDDLSVCCTGSYVHVAWIADVAAGDPDYIAVQTSSNGGATWLGAPLSASGTPGGVPTEPRICCDGANVHVVYTDTDGSIRISNSTDHGVSFTSPSTIADATPSHFFYDPEVVSSGADVIVVYNDDSSAFPALSIDVRVARSPNGGYSWSLGNPPLNTNGAHTASGGDFVLKLEGDHVFALFLDYRNGLPSTSDSDLFLNYSTDRGATWATSDIQMNTSGPVATTGPGYASLCADGNRLFVGWMRKGSPSEFRFNVSAP